MLREIMYCSSLYTCFLYTDGCDHTVGPYIYNDDDPSILGGCVHTLDLRLPNNPFHSDGCTHTVDIFLSIRMDASIPWVHVLISDMYLYMHPWFAGLLTVFALILEKDHKASQPSLLVLPLCFRGHILHSILSLLLHFPASYLGFNPVQKFAAYKL